jgi:hypothetical protein
MNAEMKRLLHHQKRECFKKAFIGNGVLSIKTGLKCRGINELPQIYTLKTALLAFKPFLHFDCFKSHSQQK